MSLIINQPEIYVMRAKSQTKLKLFSSNF